MKKQVVFGLLVTLQVVVILYLVHDMYDESLNSGNNSVALALQYPNEDFQFSPENSRVPTRAEVERNDYTHFLRIEHYTDERILPDWLQDTPVATINNDNLNERFDYATRSPETTYRIITLGDSFTFGLYVDTVDTFSERLEDLLNARLRCENVDTFEVINLGAPGIDVKYAVERFRQRGAKYDPDLIVWFLIENDFSQILEVINRRRAEYLEVMYGATGKDSLDLTEEQRKRSNMQAKYNFIEDLGLGNVLDYHYNALKIMPRLHDGSILMYTTQSPGGELRPEYVDVLAKFVSERPGAAHYASNLDLRNGGTFEFDSHPSPRGHEMIAEDLFGYLVKNDYLECEVRGAPPSDNS